MSDRWYLARAGGNPIGPLRPDAIVRRIRGGSLARDTLVWAEGREVWEPVARVPQFASEFGPEEPPDTVRVPSAPPTAGEDDEAPITARRHVPKALLENARRSRDEPPLPDVRAQPDDSSRVLPETARAPEGGPSQGTATFEKLPPVTRKFGSVGEVIVNPSPPPPPRLPLVETRPSALRMDAAPPRPPISPPPALEEWERAPQGGPIPPPYPSAFLRIAPAPPASVGPPPSSVVLPLTRISPRRETPRWWLGAIVFGAGLAVGLGSAREIARVRAEREADRIAEQQAARLRHPLYAPCLHAPLTELTAVPMRKEVSCAEGTLALQVDKPGSLALALKETATEGLVSKLPAISAALLPNSGPPSVFRALPARAVLALDLRGVRDADGTRVALEAYHDAELLAEAYETMGGHRFARWVVPEGFLDVENTVRSDAALILLRVVMRPSNGLAGASDALPAGLDLAWSGVSKEGAPEPTYLADLRAKAMKQGYWLDDARALMAAAVTAELPDDEPTALAVCVVADLLQASASWSQDSRSSIWNGCMVPHLAALPEGSRARYDALAGIWKNAQAFLDHPQDASAEEGQIGSARAYSASFGSALHASCTVDAVRAMLSAKQRVPETELLEGAPDAIRATAEKLLSSARFADALGEAIVRVRSQLLRPGEPLR